MEILAIAKQNSGVGLRKGKIEALDAIRENFMLGLTEMR